MKVLSTILTVVYHAFLGVFRLVTVIPAAAMATLLAVKITLQTIRAAFLLGYQDSWNSIYARLGQPVCEICGTSKSKVSLVVYEDCCKRWVHKTCHVAETVAKQIIGGDLFTTALGLAAIKGRSYKPSYAQIIRSIRGLQDPYEDRIYKKVEKVKKLSDELTPGMASSLFIALTR